MKKPVVSVIIPSYNHERFIRQAIDSVLNQTVDDFELLIIDDCSSDHSWEIIESYHDSRIVRIRHIQNHDAWMTLNEGVEVAQSDIIAILNSDDVFEPARLEKLLLCLTDEHIGLVGSGIRFIDDNDAPLPENNTIYQYYQCLQNNYFLSNNLLQAALKANFFHSTSNFLFRKKLHQTLHGFKPFHCIHDYEFLINAILIDPGSIRVVWKEKLLQYRYHQTNTIILNPKMTNDEIITLFINMIPELYLKGFKEFPLISERLIETFRDFQSKNQQRVDLLKSELDTLKADYAAMNQELETIRELKLVKVALLLEKWHTKP